MTTQEDIAKIYNHVQAKWDAEPKGLTRLHSDKVYLLNRLPGVPVKTGFLTFKTKLAPSKSMRLRVYVLANGTGYGINLFTREYFTFESCGEPEPDNQPE